MLFMGVALVVLLVAFSHLHSFGALVSQQDLERIYIQ